MSWPTSCVLSKLEANKRIERHHWVPQGFRDRPRRKCAAASRAAASREHAAVEVTGRSAEKPRAATG
eukprot:1772083-Pyramimonas_sp.AAC.1